MNVLCDFHHTDLYRSMVFLFEKRLGMKVFRPHGISWRGKGYFSHPDSKEAEGLLGKTNFNKDTHFNFGDTYFSSRIPSHFPFGFDWATWNWLNLEEAETLDYIICTSEWNQEPFLKLKREVAPKAKLIRYVGNENEKILPEYERLLSADLQTYRREIMNNSRNPALTRFFTPELSPEYLGPLPDLPEQFLGVYVIRCFLNFFYHSDALSEPELWRSHKELVKGMKPSSFFLRHGLGTPPGDMVVPPGTNIWDFFRKNYPRYLDRGNWPSLDYSEGEPFTHRIISNLMKNSHAIWHVKKSEGYGFVIHQAAAMGRPIICRKENFQGKAAGRLIDDSTAFFVDGTDNDRKVFERIFEPETLNEVSNKFHKRFKMMVNYEEDAESIKDML